jgi:hypothetical protein
MITYASVEAYVVIRVFTSAAVDSFETVQMSMFTWHNLQQYGYNMPNCMDLTSVRTDKHPLPKHPYV